MEVFFCFHEGVNHSGAELMEFLRILSSDGGILVVSRKCHDWYQAARKWLWNIFFFKFFTMASHHSYTKGSYCTGVNRRGVRTG